MKIYRKPLLRSRESWFYAASLAMCLLIGDTLQVRGLLILGGMYTAMYVLYLATRNCIVLTDRDLTVRNPFTRRARSYRYDSLQRVEFLRDMRVNPRIRLTDRSGQVRWHDLEGIRTGDYGDIIAGLKRSGVAVETYRMEPYLKRD